MYTIMLVCIWIANGSIELKIIPEQNHGDFVQDMPVLCAGDHLRIRCSATGKRLRWNDSGVLTFTSHDSSAPASTRTLVDDEHKLVAVLISAKSDGESSQFVSELFSLDVVTASSMSLNTTVSCSTDTSVSSLQIFIPGSQVRPQKPRVSQTTCFHNLNLSVFRLCYLQWEPPSNTDRLILANYAVQTGNQTINITCNKTSVLLLIRDQSVTFGTFVAISKCGTTSGNVTLNFTMSLNFIADSHSITSASVAPQLETTNYHTLFVVLPVALFLLVT